MIGRAHDHAKIYSVADGKSWKLKATPDENGGIVGWTADGKNILWAEANKTLNGIYVLSVDGKSITEWNKGAKDLLGAASINSTGTYIAFTLQNPSQFPEAYISSLNNYSPVKVTSINADNARQAFTKNRNYKMERR